MPPPRSVPWRNIIAAFMLLSAFSTFSDARGASADVDRWAGAPSIFIPTRLLMSLDALLQIEATAKARAPARALTRRTPQRAEKMIIDDDGRAAGGALILVTERMIARRRHGFSSYRAMLSLYRRS